MSNADSKADKLCGLCDINSSKYCCPRCEVFYCSLDCYKSEKHSECSESFYRDCVNAELASYEIEGDAKNKMIDILKRMHNDDAAEDIIDEEIDSDDCSDVDLHTRIKDLNLEDPDALWGALTEDERNEFESMINRGNIGDLIPQWEPWWSYRKEKKLLEEVNNSAVHNDYLKKCPEIIDVPKFSTLTSIKPSEAIRYNITNVLTAYTFTMRYFNGEIEPVVASTHILDICTNLDFNTNFEDPEVAVESVAQRCLQSEYIQTDKDSLDVMRNDVYCILQGPTDDNKLYYSKAAISHLIQLFSESKIKHKRPNNTQSNKNNGEFTKKYPEHDNSHFPDLDISKVKKAIKKLEYYLSFLNSCDDKNI